MEAKRLLGRLSDETIEELREKNTNFITGIQLPVIKFKKERKLARCPVRTSQTNT